MPVYVMLGALGAGVLCVLAFVLTSNDVKEKTAKLAELQSKEQGAKTVADALRPYGQFADRAGRPQAADRAGRRRAASTGTTRSTSSPARPRATSGC